MHRQVFITSGPEKTMDLAADLMAALPGRKVFALHGDLGSGKTCFVKGMGIALGIKRQIASPTFKIVSEYDGPRPLYHVDLYRVNDADSAFSLGLTEYLEADGVTAIEWAEHAEDLLPAETVHLRFESLEDPQQRRVTVEYEDR